MHTVQIEYFDSFSTTYSSFSTTYLDRFDISAPDASYINFGAHQLFDACAMNEFKFDIVTLQ